MHKEEYSDYGEDDARVRLASGELVTEVEAARRIVISLRGVIIFCVGLLLCALL